MASYATFGKAVIAAGGSLSTEVECAGATSLWIGVPTWTDSAAITFQIRSENDSLIDAYDELGVEIAIPAGTHNVAYSIPTLLGAFAIKIRSGVSGSAQAQTAEETITVYGMR